MIEIALYVVAQDKEREQIICVTLVMFIYMQKSALVHFILPEVRHLIFNRLHTSLLQIFYLLCTVVLGFEKLENLFKDQHVIHYWKGVHLGFLKMSKFE